jgi:hypothetical protein
MTRNPYRRALAAYPDAEIIARLYRLAQIEDHRQALASLKRRRVVDVWDLAQAELEIGTLRSELADLGYELPDKC